MLYVIVRFTSLELVFIDYGFLELVYVAHLQFLNFIEQFVYRVVIKGFDFGDFITLYSYCCLEFSRGFETARKRTT